MTSARVASRAVIDATTTFARISGAIVIAEGVENEYAADMMKAAGITLGQGFGIGKPTPSVSDRGRGCRAGRSRRIERPSAAVRLPLRRAIQGMR